MTVSLLQASPLSSHIHSNLTYSPLFKNPSSLIFSQRNKINISHLKKGCFSINGTSDQLETPPTIITEDTDKGLDNLEGKSIQESVNEANLSSSSSSSPAIEKDLKKVVNKAAATFAPRASTATRNPAVPGSTLYTVFEVQGYASMILGGILSFNLVFPSNEPDIWRLMGMWSIWMFTIPSLRARDCSNKEKEALNYLFLLIPLLNVTIPFFWKSFAVVWSADTVAFFMMYAWKLGWLQKTE